MASLWDHIADAVASTTGLPFTAHHHTHVGGGCINSAYRLADSDRSYFIKLNRADQLPMFEAESAGLDELVASGAVRAPRPIATGTADGKAFLAMEYIELDRAGTGSARRLGNALARMHRTRQTQFGWVRDNTIGSTPQPNPRESDWVGFWRRHRLGFQLDLAARKGASRRIIDRGELLKERLALFFTDYQPEPSLLHGDLWGGNWAADEAGNPVLYDPAVYYGDREADLAMTELFGGFPADFYAAYRETWPIDSGYRERRDLYNLYHLLNHYNLFGGGYLGQAQSAIDRLLAATA